MARFVCCSSEGLRVVGRRWDALTQALAGQMNMMPERIFALASGTREVGEAGLGSSEMWGGAKGIQIASHLPWAGRSFKAKSPGSGPQRSAGGDSMLLTL